MTQETSDNKSYPIKSLHDFLFELDQEWTKFRNGALLALVSSGFLFIIVIWLILRIRVYHLGFIDLIIFIIAAIISAYSIYAMYSQYRFLSKWERRLGVLVQIEEQMLSEKLEEPKP